MRRDMADQSAHQRSLSGKYRAYPRLLVCAQASNVGVSDGAVMRCPHFKTRRR